MSTRQLYEFVVDDNLKEEDEEARLNAIKKEVEAAAEHDVDEAVFRSTFLPRSLNEIANVESDSKKLRCRRARGCVRISSGGDAKCNETEQRKQTQPNSCYNPSVQQNVASSPRDCKKEKEVLKR